MTAADVPLGLRLREQAGWNQTEADWRRFLDLQPDGCFVAELDGAAVGTTTTCVFGRVAWVGMVLVAEPARGRGVGAALLGAALADPHRPGAAPALGLRAGGGDGLADRALSHFTLPPRVWPSGSAELPLL